MEPNKEENTKITYWVAKDNFTFFVPLLNQLNRKDKSSIYYLQLPDTKSAFPMKSVHKDMAGKNKVVLVVDKITKKTNDASLFTIPKGYNEFKK